MFAEVTRSVSPASPFCFKLNRREAVSFLGSLPFKFKRSLTFGCSWIVCVCGNVSRVMFSFLFKRPHVQMMIRRFNAAPAWHLRRVSFQFNCHQEVLPMGRHQHISTEWGVNHQNYKNSTIQRIRLMSKTSELHVPQTQELRWSLLLPACASLLSNDLDLQENNRLMNRMK